MASNFFGASSASAVPADTQFDEGSPEHAHQGPTAVLVPTLTQAQPPQYEQDNRNRHHKYTTLRREDLAGLSLGAFSSQTGNGDGGAIMKRQRVRTNERKGVKSLAVLDGKHRDVRVLGLKTSAGTEVGRSSSVYTGDELIGVKGSQSLLQQLQVPGSNIDQGSLLHVRERSAGALSSGYRNVGVAVHQADGIQFKLLGDLADAKVKRLRSEKIKPIEEVTFEDIKIYNRNQLRAYCFVYGIKRKKKADMESNMAKYAAMFHPGNPAFDITTFAPTDYVEGPIPRRRVPVTKEQKSKSAGKFAARFLPAQRARGLQVYSESRPHFLPPSSSVAHYQQPQVLQYSHSHTPVDEEQTYIQHQQNYLEQGHQQYLPASHAPRSYGSEYVAPVQQQRHHQQHLHQQRHIVAPAAQGYLSSIQSITGSGATGNVPERQLLSD